MLPIHAQDVVATPDAQCVTNYDPQVDYFPDKVEPEFAQGWRVEYHNSYKVVNVLTPFPGATAADAFTYLLVECGTPVPDGYDGAEVIQIPAGSIIAMSTSYIPQLDELGLLDHLIGMDQLAFVSNPTVRQMIDDGKLIEVGMGPSVNVEAVLDAEPSLVMTFGSGSPDYDTHPTLLAAGVPVVVASDFIEGIAARSSRVDQVHGAVLQRRSPRQRGLRRQSRRVQRSRRADRRHPGGSSTERALEQLQQLQRCVVPPRRSQLRGAVRPRCGW